MLDIAFSTPEEICKELGARLKAQRLAQALTQAELAERAGVSKGTVLNMENKGLATLESLVRIASALGLADHLQTPFTLQVKSIAQMEQAERAPRVRAPRRASK